MPEAPLEALKRLEAKLEYLHTRTTHDTNDLEDAVKVIRELIRQLEDAGVPTYSEQDLARFLKDGYAKSGHSFTEAARRFGEATEKALPAWTREIHGYALALASRYNWAITMNATGDAFERLHSARLHAENTLRDPRSGMSDLDRGVLSAYQEMARAFLAFTVPESIRSWLRENPEES